MQVNFKIKDFREIQFENHYIDLHNNFEFQGFDYQVTKGTLTLQWLKSTCDWVPLNELGKVTIVHKYVSYFKVSPSDEGDQPQDDRCLSEMTFFPATFRAVDDEFMDQEDAKDGDDIIYSFAGGAIIRVGCQDVNLIL